MSDNENRVIGPPASDIMETAEHIPPDSSSSTWRQTRTVRPASLRYGLAVVAVLIATVCRLLLNSVLQHHASFSPFFLCVLVMAWYGGLGPALLTIALSMLSAAFFFTPPQFTLGIQGSPNLIDIGVFVLVAVLTAVLSDAQRKEKEKSVASAYQALLESKARQKSDHLLSTTLRSIGDAVIATDLEGRVIFMNAVAEILTGWPSEEAVGRPHQEIFIIANEQNHRAIESPIVRVLRDGNIVRIENHTVLIAREGAERPIDDSGAPIRDTGGKLQGAVLVFRDVTDRRRAEETRLQFTVLVESSTDAIIGKTLDGIITSWNPGAERLYGYAADEMIGQSIALLVPADRPDELPDIMERLRQGEHIGSYETVRVRKDGQTVDVSINVSPIKNTNGEIIGTSTIARDISEQKAAEKTQKFLAETSALLASSLDYETTLANVAHRAVPQIADWCVVHVVAEDGGVRQLAVAHVDPDKLEWAQELQKRYPYDPNARQGVPNVLRTGQSEFYPDITDEMLVASALDEEHLAVMRRVGFTSIMIVPMQARGRTLGTISFVSAESGRHYTDADLTVAEDLALSAALAVDNARLYRASQAEVVERTRAQEALRRQTEDLQRHQAEIEALNERLRRSMQETHHRVKNNLQIIAALADMQTMAETETVPAEEFKRMGGYVRTLAAVHDVLTHQAREEGDATYLSAREILEKLLPLIEQTIGDRRILCNLDDMRLSVRQGTSLAIVANELIINALKYGQGDVEIGFAVSEEQAVLEVSDDGPGFSERFDPVDSANTGLELVRNIAQWDLKADIRFENRSQGGGCVIVTMPR